MEVPVEGNAPNLVKDPERIPLLRDGQPKRPEHQLGALLCGADAVVHAPGSGADEITDFTRGGAEADRIDLSAFDIAYEALRFTTSSTGVTVQLGGTDTIFVRGATALDPADFVFG